MTTTHIKQATQVQEDFKNMLYKWLGGTAALGAGVTGVAGLGGLIHNNLQQPPRAPEPNVVNVPYLYKKKEQQNKIASTGWGDWFMGADAKNVWDIPAAYPAVGLSGMGGLYAGHKGMKAVLDWHKKRQQEDEMEDAKSEYEKAMLGQFKPIANNKVISPEEKIGSTTIKALLTKSSSDNRLSKLADKLDQLATNSIEKKAEGEDDWSLMSPSTWKINPLNWHMGDPKTSPRAGSLTAGAYATMAPLLALGSGLGVYHYTKNNDPNTEEAEFQEKRYRERLAKKPTDLFARLVPVDEQGNHVKTSSEINAKAVAFVRDLFGE